MGFQSGILQCKVDVAGIEELSALGTAFISGLATGFFHSKDEIIGLRPVGSAIHLPLIKHMQICCIKVG